MAGVLVTTNVPKEHESFSARVFVFFMAIVMAILTFFRTLSDRVVTKQQLPAPPQIEGNTAAREEEAELLNSVLKKLTELEEKIGALQAKPNEMPSEKEELLNAAVCRVDALEAELIATKKVKKLNYPIYHVQTKLEPPQTCCLKNGFLFWERQALYEALMRQEELLAYIDRQEFAQSQVGSFEC